MSNYSEEVRYWFDKTKHSFRQTGLSTALAISTIGEALRFPGKPIKVNDTWLISPMTREGDRRMMLTVNTMLARLSLKFFTLDHKNMTLTFKGMPELNSKHIIIIDGKEVELSHESYNAIKGAIK